MNGEVAAVEAWLTRIESQFGRSAPEMPESLNDARVTRFHSALPLKAGLATRSMPSRGDFARECCSIPKRPPEGWRPQPD